MKTTASPEFLPTTGDIYHAFDAEIAALGGTVSDVFDDGVRLFLRAVLPTSAEVGPGDGLHAGVALRTAGPEILVHPYTFRVVCTNGAIRAHAIETMRIARVEVATPVVFAASYESHAVRFAIGDAVRACAASQVFTDGVQEMRSAAEIDAEQMLTLMPYLLRLSGRVGAKMASQILERFSAGADRSGFGFLNTLTAAGRDEREPEIRWRLEELGGGVPAWLLGVQSAAPTAMATQRA